MGRLSNVNENPAVKTIKWKNRKMEGVKDAKGKTIKNDDGTPKMKLIRKTGWYYYDKSTETEIQMEMPFSFIWLESATSFSGYNQNKQKGVYSNEVLNLKTDKMTVRCGEDIIAEGLYAKIKDEVKGQGGKFCIPVYAYVPETEETVRILMTGSSGSAWMGFHKTKESQTKMISCIGANEKEMATGQTYEEPTFKYVPMDSSLNDVADEKATEVSDYFKYILSQNNAPVPSSISDDDDIPSNEDDDSTDY